MGRGGHRNFLEILEREFGASGSTAHPRTLRRSKKTIGSRSRSLILPPTESTSTDFGSTSISDQPHALSPRGDRQLEHESHLKISELEQHREEINEQQVTAVQEFERKKMTSTTKLSY